MPKHLILAPWEPNRNAGGPAGYLWHLREGLEAIGDHNCEFLTVPNVVAPPSERKRAVRELVEATSRFPALWRLLKTYGPTQVASERRLIQALDLRYPEINERLLAALKDDDIVSIHCHTTESAFLTHHVLLRLNKRETVTLYLTSHCPEMPALEKTDVLLANGLQPSKVDQLRGKLLEMDLEAFRVADRAVFPCEEAMEPYFETCPSFGEVISKKTVQFVMTGIVDPERPEPVTIQARGAFRVSFVGRHTKVKGYDLLSRAVPDLLEELDALMLVGGSSGPLPTPQHPRWREFGWLPGAGGLIAASDVFVLANRRTYFDLVAIEVLALGVPILASNTGGNKRLAAMTPGVVLFEPEVDEFRTALRQLASLPNEERSALGVANRNAFEKHLNHIEFAKNYVRMLARG